MPKFPHSSNGVNGEGEIAVSFLSAGNASLLANTWASPCWSPPNFGNNLRHRHKHHNITTNSKNWRIKSTPTPLKCLLPVMMTGTEITANALLLNVQNIIIRHVRRVHNSGVFRMFKGGAIGGLETPAVPSGVQ